MVKKFTYDCDFDGEKHPVTFYIGDAAKGNNPISFQSSWLAKERGGSVPAELMDSLMRLKEIADTQKVPFEDICEYVIDEINLSKSSAPKISTKKTEPNTQDIEKISNQNKDNSIPK
ncbi:MAG: hypothetical protein ACJAZX_000120 [Rickettsiales bacterium]